MSDRVVRIVLVGDSAGAVRAIKQTEVAAASATGKLDGMHSAGQKMSHVGRAMTELAVPVVALGGYAVKTAAQFQDSMTLLRTQVGVSRGEMNRLGQSIQKLAPQVGFGPKQLADALYPLESVGLRGTNAMDALKAAAMGAQVSGASLTDTSDAVAGAMRTQMRDTHSAAGAMSIMNGTVAAGKMHLTDLLGALSTGVLPAAKAAGLSFRDVGAALAAMTRQHIPAQVEATRLQRTLMQFEAPKGQALKVLQAIGLKQFSLADDLRKPNGLIVALKDLRGHMAGLTPDQRNFVISTAFGGAKGAQNVVALLNALPNMTQIRRGLNQAGPDQLAKAMDVRKEDLSFKWQQLKATTEVALVGLGNSLMPLIQRVLPKLSHTITDVVNWLTHLPKSVKQILFWFTAFLAIGGPVLIFVGKLVSAVSAIAGVFGWLGTMVKGLGTALGVESAAIGTEGTALAGAFVGLLGPIAAAAAALGALALLHKPITHAGKTFGRKVGEAFLGTPKHPTYLGAGFEALIGSPGDNYHTQRYLQGAAFRHATAGQHALIGELLRDHSIHRNRFGTGLVGTTGLTPKELHRALGRTPLPPGMRIPGYVLGGPIGGFGGGDRRLARLEDGEYVMRKEAVRSVGVNALNSINQSGGMAGQGGQQTMMVTMPVTLRIGNSRVLAEEVIRFAARKSAMSGHWVAG